MAQPDVRVRLSAEGVQDVVDAFRRISAESQRTGKAAADSMALVTKFLGADLFARAAGYLKDFASAAIHTQDQIAKMMTKTGMSAPVLSTLSRAAVLADADLSDLGTACKFLNKNLDQLKVGNAGARDAFGRLGLSAKDFIGLNADQQFLKVATALGGVSDESERSAIATAIFGKGAQSLIPIAVELAEKGFKAMADEAERTHQLWDDKQVKQAEAFTDALKGMKLEAEALAGRLVMLGAQAPGALDKLQPYFNLLRGAIQNQVAPGTYIPPSLPSWMMGPTGAATGPLSAHGSPTGNLSAHDAATVRGKAIQGAIDYTEALARNAAFEKARLDAAKQAAAAALTIEKGRVANLETVNDQMFAQGLIGVEDYYKRRGELVDAGLSAEIVALAAQRGATQRETAQQVAAINAQINMLNLTNAEGKDVEIKNLTAKRDAVELEGRTKVKAIDDQINKAAIDADNKRLANTGQLTNAELAEGLARLDLEKQIAEAQGDTYTATLLAIQKQGEELARTLHTTINDPAIQKLTDLLKFQAVGAQFQQAFGLGQRGLAAGTGALDAYQQSLQARVTGGQLFPAQAQDLYSKAVAQQLPILQQQLDVLKQAAKEELDSAVAVVQLADATGGATQQERDAVLTAQEHVTALDNEQTKLNETATAANFAAQQMGIFKQGLQEAMAQDLAGWLSSGIDQATGFGDAMRQLALSVVQSVRQLAAQLLAAIIMQKLFAALLKTDTTQPNAPLLMGASIMMAVGGTIVSKAAQDLERASGELMAAAMALIVANSMGGGIGHAGGGMIYGRGTDTSDNIRIWASPGEYVVRAAAVRALGIGTLELINQGVRPPGIAPRGHAFAAGGLVGGLELGGGAARGGLTAMVGFDEPLLLKRLEASPEFARVIVHVAENHSKKLNAALGR